ncbi:hypothetical protein SPRG_13893 [Saprolegnia parasitica CBS 223.65]|uniref:Uncharacterized protein n=1 Tax=Saprolegnia parasitica (strain CBS 223.65) TaxID=695850 RepID=A0A067C2F5_SAPPC|nr:hypothetical protein SPRG_13893 [Saprolegnia parasitica CBS 223.65]KDO20997.1 hypothetical protein SPRG_13893 [Saprolegnia parasitica CBS 223.65]|eukprot:XP_012208309.1 hypothetical protein SPRG_13893 [Saprolegnia parasitica CBS 223.65]
MKAEVRPSPDAPKTTAFQVGKVATDPWKASFQDASIRVGAGEKEESYIPVQLARQSLQRVVDDMHEMKARQQEKVQAIMDRYAAIEASTKQHYEAFVLDIKRRALERVQTQKQQYAQLRLETDAERQVATARIESLEASARDMHDRQVQMLAMYQSERETLLLDQALELGSLKKAYEVEQSRLRELWLAKTATLEQAHRWLHMRSEDDAARCMELNATLTTVTATAKHQHMHQVASAQTDQAIALHVAQAVSDLCWQVALLHRPLVVHQMTATDAAPSPRPLPEPKEVLCQETQTILDHVQNEASEAQTALVAAKVQPLTQHDGIDISCFEQRCEEALRHQLRAAEHTRDVCELQIVRDVLDQLVLETACAHADWLAEFEATNHREPSIQDKAQVKDMYIAFKQAEEHYNRSREQLNAQKQLYAAKLAEVETLQSSQTMQTFPHHTLVAHLRAALDDTQRRLDVALHKPITPALVDRGVRASSPHIPPRTNETMAALQKRVDELSAQLQIAQANAQLHASEASDLGTMAAATPLPTSTPDDFENASTVHATVEAALQAALDDARHAQADLQHNVDTLHERIRALEADAAVRATELATGTSCTESVAAIKQTIAETKTLVAGKAAVALRKQLDAFVVLADAEPIGKGGKDDDVNSRLLNKKLQDAEKKAKAALDEAEKQATRRIASLTNELQAATTNVTSLTAKIDELNAQVADLSAKATLLNNVQGEVEKLRQDAATAAQTAQELSTLQGAFAKLEDNYKE